MGGYYPNLFLRPIYRLQLESWMSHVSAVQDLCGRFLILRGEAAWIQEPFVDIDLRDAMPKL